MTGNNSLPVRIVGGGMTGLTLALRLARRGKRVVVHERDPYLGGLASECPLDGASIEKFYHCILPSADHLLELLREIGLQDEVGWTRTRTGFYLDGTIHEMSAPLDLLKFEPLTMYDRLRLIRTVMYCSLNRRWERFDHEPVSSFLRRLGGDRVFEKIWEPLLLAKLGPAYDRFPASFIWATIHRMMSARRGKGRRERLGYIKGGYGLVFSALRKEIERLGGEVSTGVRVEGISRSTNGDGRTWTVRANGRELIAAGVALCVPAPAAAGLVRDSLPEVHEILISVDYLGVVCEAILLRHSLTPHYILNLADRRLPFTGVIEMSNLTGRWRFGGHALVYLPRYCSQDSPLWSTADDVIHRDNMDGIRRIVPQAEERDVLAWEVNRARFVQPIHPVHGKGTVPPVQLAPGLAFLSPAQIHPWPVVNDEIVRLVDDSIDEVLSAVGGWQVATDKVGEKISELAEM